MSSLWPFCSPGSVPLMKNSGRLLGVSAVAIAPVAGSMSLSCTPEGICQSPVHSGCVVNAALMKSAQIGSADAAPVNPNCDPSSNPTQTTQTKSGVYPTNQPSRDVPVLPATLYLNPRARIGAAVPRLTTSFMNEVIR